MERYVRLTPEQERAAREQADISEGSFYILLVALSLVAAFSFFMVATHG